MAHAQKPDLVFRRNGRLNRRGRQFSRLLAVELCASAVVMVDTPCSEVVWSVLATHSIRQFPLYFASRASPCAITFQPESNNTSIVSSSWWWAYKCPKHVEQVISAIRHSIASNGGFFSTLIQRCTDKHTSKSATCLGTHCTIVRENSLSFLKTICLL